MGPPVDASLFFASGLGHGFFFADRWAVGQFTLVVHGGFLSNECHVGGGGALNRASENTVVRIGSPGKRLPSTASEGVTALLAGPNADRGALDLRVLTHGAGVLVRSLGHRSASVSTNGHTVSSSKSGGCTGFLGSLCQSVPLLFCHEFSEFHASLLGHLKDLGKLGGSEHPF